MAAARRRAYPHQKTWPLGGVAVCPRPIRVAENLRRRKSATGKRFPQPTPVPKTPTQLIEISSTLKESLVRWVHTIPLDVFAWLTKGVLLDDPGLTLKLVLLTSLAARCVLLAFITYQFIEIPFQRLGRHIATAAVEIIGSSIPRLLRSR